MPEKVDILIRNGLVLTQDLEHHIYYDTDIAARDGKIFAIGKTLPFVSDITIDARHKLVMPGLVNAHMHETLTRGVCEDLPLNRWLEDICFPLDRSYTPEIMQASALMCQLEMILSGITTFVDIYRYPAVCAEVAQQSGLRAMIFPQIMTDPSDVGESIDAAEGFVSAWKGCDPRIIPGFGPHAPYSVTPSVYTELALLAQKYDLPMHTHLSETKWEVDLIKERYGCTSTEMLFKAGALSPRLSVAHAIFLTDSDVSLLLAHGVAVVYNPSSNMKLASGIARIPDYISAGLTVGLGTDSNLSNNNLDMFEEMRLGAVLQKLGRSDATALPVQTVLDMATRFGARALALEDQIGSLELGKQADIILLDLKQPHLWPVIAGKYQNIEEQVVYAANASDVTHTIVAGQLLMADRQVLTLDLEAAYQVVHDATSKVMNRAGLL
jgi:5-methylthioadenosine/S-adenosylhomocysteine deaminase